LAWLIGESGRAGGFRNTITTFAALMTAVQANGWIVTTAAYPSANWQMMAATPTAPVIDRR